MIVNQITVDNFASLFGCTPSVRASDYDGSGSKSVGACRAGSGRVYWTFFCFSISFISRWRILNVVASLYSFDFDVLEDVALMS